MRVIADRHLNLHSASTEGGLVHVPRRRAKIVPDDVQEHPMFDRLVKHGNISVLKGDQPALPEIEEEEEVVDDNVDKEDREDNE